MQKEFDNQCCLKVVAKIEEFKEKVEERKNKLNRWKKS